jgi:preprotein translocase subunit SecF
MGPGADTISPERPDTRASNPFSRLYRGETSFDFVGRRRTWFAISSLVILAGLISLATRGLNFGIEFKGGTSWQVPSASAPVSGVQGALTPAGLGGATVEVLGSGSHRTIEVQANLQDLPTQARTQKEQAVSADLARVAHVPVSTVSVTDVGPTWGGDITSKAVRALVVFFLAIALYITFRFEWKMAVAALIAVLHDILLTVGIYSLSGFQVTPATVIAFLTILGYSLYDTIVVFDRVKENAKSLGATGRITYSDMVNLSMNQVLARSVNTSLVAIMPILSVLVVGAELLGATTLQDFGLALFVGLTTGAYSSIFIASPILAMIKEHEPRYEAIRARLVGRADGGGRLTPAAAAAGGLSVAAVAPSAGNGSSSKMSGRGPRTGSASGRTGTGRPGATRQGGARRPPPRPRKKGKRR